MSLAVGVIGAGIMGGSHARALSRSVTGAVVLAVSDPDRDKAASVAAAIETAEIYPDPFALIDDRRVDAVVIASPDPTHEALVLACLSSGKPVLCEKPLSPDVGGCLRIVAAEVSLGRRLVQVGFMRRFDPGVMAMREVLARGQLGAPLLMHGVHRNASVPPSFDATMPITNSAVHEIDIARWLLAAEFASASVFAGAATPPAGPARPLLIVLETDGGVVVSVEVFVNARYGYDVRAEVVCEAGSVALAPRALVRLRHAGREAESLAEDWRAHYEAAYRNQLQAWVDSVASGAPAGASAWDGYAATATAAACLEALRTGAKAPVRLAPRPALYA